jgi:hypothetical protein
MQRQVLCHGLSVVLFLAAALNLSAQGTAISYQGQLNDSGSPANTNYDFRFAVFSAPTNGSQVSAWLTNSDVPVANGLFRVTLEFAPGVFNGTSNGSNDWLDVAVRLAGTTSFTPLTPRQPILPVPYALFATSASNLLGTLQATQLVGTIASSIVSGTYSNVVNFVNATNTFTGTFTGNGTNLNNLNASQVTGGTLADVRLQSDVALTDVGQTYTGANTYNSPLVFNAGNTFTGANTFTGPNSFSGVSTLTNNNNYFIGSFFGNGLVGWLPVYGPATNAMRDAGYLLLNAGLSTVTLPATASLSVGDIVRVSGGGGGGWLVKQNSGQSIIGNFAKYTNGTLAALPNSPSSDGRGVAASADGVTMYAVGFDITGVYSSSDSGRTWSLVSGTQLSGYWSSVACSANGRIVYAEPESTSSTIQKSINGGVTWASTGVAATGSFISCTADGSTLITGNVACSGNGSYRAKLAGGVITVSVNSGGTFAVNVPAPASGVTCLGASSDCTRLVAGVSNGMLYATSNLGSTWSTLTTSNQLWSSAWVSPDGSRFAAAVSASGSFSGGIFSCAVSALPNNTTTVSTGSLCGSQGSAVELQHLGNGLFMPVSSTGLLWAN